MESSAQHIHKAGERHLCEQPTISINSDEQHEKDSILMLSFLASLRERIGKNLENSLPCARWGFLLRK